MKKIYLIIIISLVFTFSCKAQLNELTQTEFNNIKFNNVTLKSILDTNADLTKMRMLFGNTLLSQSNTTGPYLGRDFWNENIYFNYEENSDVSNDYNLTNIQIKSSFVNISVKGIIVKIGDNKSVFGNNVVINTNNGDNSIVFIDSLTGAAALAFKIDKATNKVVSVEFNVYD